MAKKMKSNKLLLFIVGIITFISYSFSVKADQFNELLTRGDLIFTQPENFTSVGIVDQNNMQYEYALKHNSKNFEVRYAIRPLDELIKTYDKKEKNKKEKQRNRFYRYTEKQNW